MNIVNINELDKNKLTIACTTNQKYMHYVKPFLNSIEKGNCLIYLPSVVACARSPKTIFVFSL